MSKGNQKTEGGKGRNYPFQLNVLKGLQQSIDALNIINNSTSATALGVAATEITLQSVLAAVQNGTDYEAKLVIDNDNETWLEVRVWNTGSESFDPPVYYKAGSNDTGTPAAPINYINPLTLLATIANNTAGLNLETTQELIRLLLVSLDNKDFAAEATLSSVDTTTTNAYNELLNQGLTLNDIETALQTLNSTVSTELTLQAVVAELQNITLNVTGLSQESTQLLVLAALNTVISNTSGFATEVTLNALLTAFNAEDFASEATLNNLSNWVQSNAATEATLQNILAETQSITGNTVNINQEATQLLVLAALNNILLDTVNLDVPLSALSTEATSQSILNALTPLATESTLASLETKDFATETTLQNVDTKLNAAEKTPNIIRPTGSGTINEIVYSFSVANVGGNDGVILGATIKDGEVLSFSAGSLNNFYASSTITYDATGTEFIITYNT